MAVSIEFLSVSNDGRTAAMWLKPCMEGALRAGFEVRHPGRYEGKGDWLCLFGPGFAEHDVARRLHVESGRPVACWDVGYLGKTNDPETNYVRVSINGAHPSIAHINATPADPSRWRALGIELPVVDQYNPDGHVLVIGMGAKSRNHLGDDGATWESTTLLLALARFPGRIVYRAKPHGPAGRKTMSDETVQWDGERSTNRFVADDLHDCSLVICRHSNVAIDACIVGVPVECSDGAAYWLYRHGPRPSRAERQEFLNRLAWWQWRFAEMDRAWNFLQAVYASTSVAAGRFSLTG